MAGLRVLITNHGLADRAGTELYVRDVATALLARGHQPVAYSPVLGQVAEDLRAATIPVVDDLSSVAVPPDVIHGQHHLPTMTALLHFPGVPAVSFCHGWMPWEEAVVRFPRVYRYVAVDEVGRSRLTLEHGIAEERVCIVPNFVDLERFKPRGPLPPRPRRALVFSNGASEYTHLPAVRGACARLGLEVDVVGAYAGATVARPEEILGQYDVVLAKGRAALEALAVGASVVLCDVLGVGPLITAGEFDRLRSLNFGMRTLNQPVLPDVIAREIARYDPRDAAEVSRRVRAEAGRDAAVDTLVTLYGEAISEHGRRGGADAREEGRAAAAYLRWLNPALRDSYDREQRAVRAGLERDQALAAAEDERARSAGRLAELSADLEASEGRGRELASRVEELEGELRAERRARAELETRAGEVERLTRRQEELEGLLSASRAEAEQRAARHAAAVQDLEARERELEGEARASGAALAELRRVLAERDAEIARITGSLGWRLRGRR